MELMEAETVLLVSTNSRPVPKSSMRRMRTTPETTRKGSTGQALVFATLALVFLFGCIGLAVDMGNLRVVKRRMQSAADSAAIAGASELKRGNPTTSAQGDASRNGFTDGSNSVTVTVNNPPTSGPHTGDSSYVEVLVSQSVPTSFMRLLNINSVTMQARAVGGTRSTPICGYALDPTASKAIVASGGSSLSAPGCGFVSSSSNSDALDVSGGSTITGGSIGVVGNANNGTGCSPPSCSPRAVTGVIPAPNPLASLPPPAFAGSCSFTTQDINSGTVTLSAGVYCGGINIHSGAKVNLNAGTYVVAGNKGFTVGDKGTTVSGAGVTIYDTTCQSAALPNPPCTYGNNYAPIMIKGGATATLSAPTSGPLDGILFFQDATLTGITSVQNGASGGSVLNLTGVLYFPSSSLYVSGGSGGGAGSYTVLIADILNFSGGSTLINSNFSAVPGGSPIKAAVLVE